jgi:hypothetical protein
LRLRGGVEPLQGAGVELAQRVASAFALSSVSSGSGRGMGPDDKAKAQGRRLNNSAFFGRAGFRIAADSNDL